MADVNAPPFDPVWLYHPDRGTQGEMVEDQETYEALVKTGWVHSPAEFGVITTPNKAQELQQAMSAGGEAPPGRVVPPPPVHDDIRPRLDGLGEALEALQTRLSDQHKMITTLTARVAKLEEPPSATGRR